MMRSYPVPLCTVYLFLAALLCAGACSGPPDAPSRKPGETLPPLSGGTYSTPLRGNPATLDPALVRDYYGESLVHQLFDGLVRFDAYLSVVPCLAETWQVDPNGKVYRFFLKPDARFHDGSRVTALDALFSLERLIRVEDAPAILPHLLKIQGAEAYRAFLADRVDGLEIPDDRTLVVRLAEPHVPFLAALGMCYAKVVPARAVAELGNRFGREPVGSGPFRFVSWKEGGRIRLERFADYHDVPSWLDAVEFRIYPGGQDQRILADFQAGILADMPVFGSARESLAGMPGLQWIHRPSLSLFFYGMNLNHPVLADPNLRKALALALERERLVKEVYGGRFDAATAILPPGIPGYTPANRLLPYDPDAATALVDAAVRSLNGVRPSIEIASGAESPWSKKELALVSEFWSRAGFEVRIRYIPDWPEFEAFLQSDQVQIYRYAWYADMPDPDSFLYSLFASDSPVNFMHFQDSRVDRMLVEARRNTDPIKRSGTYQAVESRVLEALPLIPIFYMSVDRVYQPWVHDIAISALGAHTMTLNRIWLDRTP